LRKWAEGLGYEIVDEYTDRASGGNSNRPQFQEMMGDARIHRFDVVLVWSLDRFSREGIRQTLAYIRTLQERNIALKSLKDSWLDTGDSGMGELLLAIFSWIAEQERKRISERIKAGLKNSEVGRRGKDKKPRRKSGYYMRWMRKKGE
jgi:DNA invertase Pin-like site-specific DNA recombinase